MLGFYNYTVVLTYVGMLTGFAGILIAAGGQVSPALLCLLGAGFCDMFDGKIASTRPRTQQEKRFGSQIDSLSDLVCFGVLPAVIVWCAAGASPLLGRAMGAVSPSAAGAGSANAQPYANRAAHRRPTAPSFRHQTVCLPAGSDRQTPPYF